MVKPTPARINRQFNYQAGDSTKPDSYREYQIHAYETANLAQQFSV